MKALVTSLLIASAISGSALAKPKPDAPAQPSAAELNRALAAVAASADAAGPKPPEHFNPKTDNDQGDDNANPKAILKVCTKDTPAAHRAAICPVGVSPD